MQIEFGDDIHQNLINMRAVLAQDWLTKVTMQGEVWSLYCKVEDGNVYLMFERDLQYRVFVFAQGKTINGQQIDWAEVLYMETHDSYRDAINAIVKQMVIDNGG